MNRRGVLSKYAVTDEVVRLIKAEFREYEATLREGDPLPAPETSQFCFKATPLPIQRPSKRWHWVAVDCRAGQMRLSQWWSWSWA